MEKEKCSSLNDEYRQCLGRSGRNPGKCQAKEVDLRKCAKSTGQNFCIDETIKLMNCAKSPSRDICAKDFVSLRECNRPTGPQLVANSEGGYNIVEGAKYLYTPEASKILASAPPSDSASTSLKGLQSAARAYADKLGLGGLENIRF